MSAPSALRNRAAIAEVVARNAPVSGRAIELASGTGEHVVTMAAATPGLMWYPTEVDEDRRRSVDGWVAAAGLQNVAPARHLDACAEGWSNVHDPADLIVLVNLLHLVPARSVAIALREIAAALAPGGAALIYGPFLRDGRATSPGDRAFDASLRAQDPKIGYKDADDIAAQMAGVGADLAQRLEMPANNLMLVFEKA